ncbi:hypothetical protein L873DRAFT_1786107 [Choiromyces venosus 120613-1]|uniref:Uncharacterized protein n=1 Tax=Choiromyces venosus 120613-1 TaxID=1336337 RepID=A0A3N4K6Y0_9PEZI|nr:hypothetical protein L873DRAFT_1786107 [Choiromyces venosus 120613-1]
MYLQRYMSNITFYDIIRGTLYRQLFGNDQTEALLHAVRILTGIQMISFETYAQGSIGASYKPVYVRTLDTGARTSETKTSRGPRKVPLPGPRVVCIRAVGRHGFGLVTLSGPRTSQPMVTSHGTPTVFAAKGPCDLAPKVQRNHQVDLP